MSQSFKALFFSKKGKRCNEKFLPIYVRLTVDDKESNGVSKEIVPRFELNIQRVRYGLSRDSFSNSSFSGFSNSSSRKIVYFVDCPFSLILSNGFFSKGNKACEAILTLRFPSIDSLRGLTVMNGLYNLYDVLLYFMDFRPRRV